MSKTANRNGLVPVAAALCVAAVACGTVRSQASPGTTKPQPPPVVQTVSIRSGVPTAVGPTGSHPGPRKGAAGHRGRSPASTESEAASATTGAGATSSATRRSAITSLLASVAASSTADSSATGSSPTTRASATRRVGTTSTVHITGASASEKTKVRARKTPTTVAPTTPRTVMGGGNAATWPAARPFPPSLAGAYSTNLKTAFIALVTYSDWLGSHPNPNFVRNYVATNSNIYHPQVYVMQQMLRRGGVISPQPTEIDSLQVVTPPVRRILRGGQAYLGGVIDVVINEKRYAYLDHSGHVAGHTAGGGPTAYNRTTCSEQIGQPVSNRSIGSAANGRGHGKPLEKQA